jgi:hypothetical protein
MCNGRSIRFVSCGHIGYQFSAVCQVIGCLKAQGFVQILPQPGFCPKCSPLTQNIPEFNFERPEVATLRAQAYSLLHELDGARDRENQKEERIQKLEMAIQRVSEQDPGHKVGSEIEDQKIGTGGDQTQHITPRISELHLPGALEAAFEALRNGLDDREDFWLEHIIAIEKELKMAFQTVSWGKVILTKEELDKLNCFRQFENLRASKLD